MAFDTATFNSQSLGDNIETISTGNIDRTIVDRQLLRNNAIDTRDQGGGRQSITLTCYREGNHFMERLVYVQDLVTACGNAKATLTVSGVGGPDVSWTNCLLVSTREDETDGSYTRFTMTFIRSLV